MSNSEKYLKYKKKYLELKKKINYLNITNQYGGNPKKIKVNVKDNQGNYQDELGSMSMQCFWISIVDYINLNYRNFNLHELVGNNIINLRQLRAIADLTADTETIMFDIDAKYPDGTLIFYNPVNTIAEIFNLRIEIFRADRNGGINISDPLATFNSNGRNLVQIAQFGLEHFELITSVIGENEISNFVPAVEFNGKLIKTNNITDNNLKNHLIQISDSKFLLKILKKQQEDNINELKKIRDEISTTRKSKDYPTEEIKNEFVELIVRSRIEIDTQIKNEKTRISNLEEEISNLEKELVQLQIEIKKDTNKSLLESLKEQHNNLIKIYNIEKKNKDKLKKSTDSDIELKNTLIQSADEYIEKLSKQINELSNKINELEKKNEFENNNLLDNLLEVHQHHNNELVKVLNEIVFTEDSYDYTTEQKNIVLEGLRLNLNQLQNQINSEQAQIINLTEKKKNIKK